MNMNLKVSVVIPCFNHGAYISDAIESVLNQTYRNIELFVFDNGSTDDSWENINKFEDTRLTKIRFEQNDMWRVKQEFVRLSEGELCAILYSDDVWEINKLEKQIQMLEKHTDSDACVTWSLQVDENLQAVEGFINHAIERNKSKCEWFKSFVEHSNSLSCPSLLCKRYIYEEIFSKLYPYRQIADFYSWFLILQKTNICIVEEILVKQRIHLSGSVINESARTEENLIREYYEMNEMFFKIIDEMNTENFAELCLNVPYTSFDGGVLETKAAKFTYLKNLRDTVFDSDEIAKRYYFKYFDFYDDGQYFYQYLEKKHGFSRNDFFTFTGIRDKRSINYESRIKRWRALSAIDSFDDNMGIDSLVIYGCGDIGKVLYERIKGVINVKAFIDRTPQMSSYKGIPVYGVDECKLDKDDYVVIVPSYDFDIIKNRLLKCCKEIRDNHILSFEEFVLKYNNREEL